MKLPDGFDARRLRPPKPQIHRWRIGAVLSALCAALGILLAMAGAASLFGRPPNLPGLDAPGISAIPLLILGLLSLWIGVLAWRLCRRRLRRPSDDLSLAPHLLKKRN